MQQFPKFAWKKNEGEGELDVIQHFIRARPDNHWVLCHNDVVISDLQLWTAWEACTRRFHRKSALARTIDAEFLRYLSGTHHVSEAFVRSGVNINAEQGWLLFLPHAIFSNDTGTQHIIDVVDEDVQEVAVQILEQMQCQLEERQPAPSPSSLTQLGISNDLDPIDIEQSSIAHIHQADLQS